MAPLGPQEQVNAQLRSECTCGEQLAGECHLRAYGVLMLDDSNGVVHADAEAVEALRGPAEEWDGDQARALHDGSFSGTVYTYWELLERLSVGSSSDTHHYLVVRRTEDGAICWIQTCIHSTRTSAGRLLHIWHVRDITGAARCLEMSRMAGDGDYTLSLEDDGLPHSSLLTQVPDVCPSSDPSVRKQLADILSAVVSAEAFAVLHLTSFGAMDTVFPRRILGWSEADLLDRSFIGLLCPEDRAFFCRALRRCHRDGIPQRLVLKLASGFAPSDEAPVYLGCDVTVLMPEAVQQPVLVVRATDQPPLPGHSGPLSTWRSSVQHVVRRVQLDCVSVQADSTPAASAICVQVHKQGADSTGGAAPVSPSLPTASLSSLPAPAHLPESLNDDSMHNATSFVAGTCCPRPIGVAPTLVDTASQRLLSQQSGIGQALAAINASCATGPAPATRPVVVCRGEQLAQGSADSSGYVASSLVSPTLPVRTDTESTMVSLIVRPADGNDDCAKVEIPMCEIFAAAKALLPPLATTGRSKAHPCFSADTVYGQFSPASSTLTSILERFGPSMDTGGSSSSNNMSLCAAESLQQKSC
ncbi:hypothetical protein GGF43_001400 [Coemansia sp. RSA 2618]|nr:hypothetical protein GGF43_001400 [Coemansia sp. RSA 2618]